VFNSPVSAADPRGEDVFDWLVRHLPDPVVDWLTGPVNSGSTGGAVTGYVVGGLTAIGIFVVIVGTGPGGVVIFTVGIVGATAGGIVGSVEGSKQGDDFASGAKVGARCGLNNGFWVGAVAGVIYEWLVTALPWWVTLRRTGKIPPLPPVHH